MFYVSSYIFTTNYNYDTKKLVFIAFDYTTSTNGINPTKYLKDLGNHHCSSYNYMAHAGIDEIHIAFTYFVDTYHYVVAFNTGSLQKVCNGVYSRYRVFTINPYASTIQLTNILGSFNNQVLFYAPDDPKLQNEGVPSINGFTKVIDVINIKVNGKMFVATLVFYEDS